MEQKDYILREIEKIGKILNAIRYKIFGGNGKLAINIEKEVEDAKGMLLNELNFDLDKFLLLESKESNEYLISVEGFNVENIELLAEFTSQIGFTDNSEESRKYLLKSIQLYELSNLKSKTFSFEREEKIQTIKKLLE